MPCLLFSRLIHFYSRFRSPASPISRIAITLAIDRVPLQARVPFRRNRAWNSRDRQIDLPVRSRVSYIYRILSRDRRSRRSLTQLPLDDRATQVSRSSRSKKDLSMRASDRLQFDLSRVLLVILVSAKTYTELNYKSNFSEALDQSFFDSP